MMPWICAENYDESMLELKNNSAALCMGHFEIAGFTMHRGMTSDGGLSREIFRKFDMVFSGHFHHRSTSDNISYLGNPYELTWQDYNDTRGFHLFDLSTRTLEFIPNPNVMFHRIVYDDKVESITEITNKDLYQEKDLYSQKYEEKDLYTAILVPEYGSWIRFSFQTEKTLDPKHLVYGDYNETITNF